MKWNRPTLKPGDRVHLASIGTGVIREIRNGGRCVVEVKGRALLVEVDRLEPADDTRGRKRTSAATPPVAPASTPDPGPRSVDLHGLIVAEAIEVLDAFLNDALLAGATTVHVIHGRTGGRLKAAVHARLSQLSSVRSFRLDPANPGVTTVRL